jgi:hypothetical protein
MVLFTKMIYLFAFDTAPNSLNLGEKLVYYNNIQHLNKMEDWQKLVDNEINK